MKKIDIKNISLEPSDLEDFNTVLICAIRYSLGRRTYIPGLVTDFIMNNCKQVLTKKSLFVMIQDIERCENYGDKCDEETWTKFLIWLKTKYEKIKEGEIKNEN